MNNRVTELIKNNVDNIIKITVSDVVKGADIEYKKLAIRPLMMKGEKQWQAESFKNNQAFHSNMSSVEFVKYVDEFNFDNYKQVLIQLNGSQINVNKLPNGKIKVKEIAVKTSEKSVAIQSHNKEKNYLLSEGEEIPALVDLGVFTSDYKLIKSKFSKYRQINRFVEMVDDTFKKCNKKSVTILDFGCGKSYLTFILYYYFTVKRGIEVKVIGYDIKADVVKECNEIAVKYGYKNLEFHLSDVTKDELYKGDIDMMITLHACDIATDYALNFAIKNEVKYIFSVPCCQHEINLSIKKGGEFDIMMKHGIIKERFSALLTDSIRASVLEAYGYKVELLEFVDLSHSPKNIMIRAVKTASKTIDTECIAQLRATQNQYGYEQSLLKLL